MLIGGGASDIEDWRINVALKIGSLEVELRTLRVLVIVMCIMMIIVIIMCGLVCFRKQ